jgi:hypothetical protein
MPTKRTPEDVLKFPDRAALDRDRQPAAPKKSASEVKNELRDAGFDVEMEKAESRAWRENLERDAAAEHGENPPRSLSHIRSLRPPPPRPVVNWVAAASVLALVGGGWLSARYFPIAPTAVERGASARQKAFDACRAGRWRECLDLFDKAKLEDPPGDADPGVQAERARAQQELASRPK